MPNHLILVRHGESEGNVATDAAKVGDTRFYTDEFITTPGHQWRLTATGRAQAAAAGAWIAAHTPGMFDRYYVSPYVRTRETAGHLALKGAQWRLNRALRERDWGDIGSLTRTEFETRPEYTLNAWMKTHDPLYWRPPGGESIASVAEDRVRNILDTLHRECSERAVIAVAHGELIAALQLVLERLDDDEFKRVDADKTEKIHNCEIFHYTRIDPHTGRQAARLTWLRRARPVARDGIWRIEPRPWRELEFTTYTNDELLEQVEHVPALFATHQI